VVDLLGEVFEVLADAGLLHMEALGIPPEGHFASRPERPDLMCAQWHRGYRWCVKSVARHPTGSVSERALRCLIGPTTSLSLSDSAA
jgi:hypothetical protein